MRFFLVITLFAISIFARSQPATTLLMRIDLEETNNSDSIDFFYKQLMEIAKDDTSLRMRAHIKRAGVALLLNDFDLADSLTAMGLSELEIEDQVELHRIKGNILSEQGKNDEALESFYRALDLTKRHELEELEPEIYFDLAAVVRKNSDLETATRYYHDALRQAKNNNDTDLEIRALIQMCKVYNGWIILNLDSSVYYGEKAIALAHAKNYEYGYAHALSIAAAPFIRVGQNQRGIKLSRKALTYADKYNFPLITIYYLIANQGFAFKNLEMYDSALFYMKEAGKLREESLDYPRLKYQVLKAQKKYKEALEALEFFSHKTDSIQRNRAASKLSSMQARYETNLKEEELKAEKQLTSLQQAELDQQRYLIFGMIVIVFLLVFALAMVYRQRKLKRQKTLSEIELAKTQTLLEMERQYRASELKAIRSQMNPHFVFNALNSIQEYIMTNEKKLAGKYLGKFADLMRIYLEHSQARNVTVNEELNAMKLYLELEKLRFGDSLNYEIATSPEVNMETPIPSLLLQPYVENAIKHGLLHKKGDRKLNVSIGLIGEFLQAEISDNGVGRSRSMEINKSKNPNHKSFATSATKSRLELLNMDKEQPIIEEIIDLEDEAGNPAGTKVILKIPQAESPLEDERPNSEIDSMVAKSS